MHCADVDCFSILSLGLGSWSPSSQTLEIPGKVFAPHWQLKWMAVRVVVPSGEAAMAEFLV